MVGISGTGNSGTQPGLLGHPASAPILGPRELNVNVKRSMAVVIPSEIDPVAGTAHLVLLTFAPLWPTVSMWVSPACHVTPPSSE